MKKLFLFIALGVIANSNAQESKIENKEEINWIGGEVTFGKEIVIRDKEGRELTVCAPAFSICTWAIILAANNDHKGNFEFCLSEKNVLKLRFKNSSLSVDDYNRFFNSDYFTLNSEDDVNGYKLNTQVCNALNIETGRVIKNGSYLITKDNEFTTINFTF